MSLQIGWWDVALRLACALVAGTAIGLNRTAHGRVAGLRTAVLVSLTACLAMLQVNFLLAMGGRAPDSFVNLDLMRLPLGILSGMGFIGAGAILRRGQLIVGVTTAASLWFLTMLGLCFGGGQIVLGFVGLLLGLAALTVMQRLERVIRSDRRARMNSAGTSSGPAGVTLASVRCTDRRLAVRHAAVAHRGRD